MCYNSFIDATDIYPSGIKIVYSAIILAIPCIFKKSNRGHAFIVLSVYILKDIKYNLLVYLFIVKLHLKTVIIIWLDISKYRSRKNYQHQQYGEFFHIYYLYQYIYIFIGFIDLSTI